jgi:3-hydroxymyristoyl/3-hydroxydecanoyl-(acyl carrier protein) dehydratase
MLVLPDVVDVTAAPQRAVLTLGIRDDLHYFRGHFDGCAILPGVVQIAWALQFGRQYLAGRVGGATHCIGMKSIKFTRVIRPSDPVQLRLEAAVDGKSLNFSYDAGRGNYSSGTLLLQ